MYPIASNIAALLNSDTPQKLRITGTDANGIAISITEADVMQGSFSIDRFSSTGQKLEIGSAGCAELKLKLNNYSGAFTSIAFEGSELYVQIGVTASGTTTWIPCGYFIVDEQEHFNWVRQHLNLIEEIGYENCLIEQFGE